MYVYTVNFDRYRIHKILYSFMIEFISLVKIRFCGGIMKTITTKKIRIKF